RAGRNEPAASANSPADGVHSPADRKCAGRGGGAISEQGIPAPCPCHRLRATPGGNLGATYCGAEERRRNPCRPAGERGVERVRARPSRCVAAVTERAHGGASTCADNVGSPRVHRVSVQVARQIEVFLRWARRRPGPAADIAPRRPSRPPPGSVSAAPSAASAGGAPSSGPRGGSGLTGRTFGRRRSPERRRRARREALLFGALIAPNLIAIIVFSYYPSLYNIGLSFFEWDFVAPTPE